MTTLRIGTRGSALALWQAHHVRDRLIEAHPGLTVELQVIKTTGDRIRDRQLSEIGGKGLFVKEIEQALLDAEVDLAVHSAKDMPTDQPDGLVLAVFPERAQPFDVLCHRHDGETLATLPAGARIGTGSLRRGSQLKQLRPDIEVVPIRGNVGTRLDKRFEPENLDGVVLAEAGLRRLDIWEEGRFERLAPPDFLPAPAQGILAIETRAGDADTMALLGVLDHAPTRIAVTAERACLRNVEGDCHTPFGAYAEVDGDKLRVQARLIDDGASVEATRVITLRADDALDQAEAVGTSVAQQILARVGEVSQVP